MPRTSEKRRAVRKLKKTIEQREKRTIERYKYDVDDEFEDDLDDYYQAELERVEGNRYYTRKKKYQKREDRWKALLHDRSYLSDKNFLAHFRVTRATFGKLVDLIKDDPLFQSAPHRTFRGGADLHLLVLLKFLGTYGNENTSPKLALFFGLGDGSISNYLVRATAAVLALESATITWPDQDERALISQRIQVKYGFPNRVGMVDGTLLPLERKPKMSGEDYYTRKGGYALNALITCDDIARVRDVVVGWPGSVHDNRVWSNTELRLEPHRFFAPNQYLLGDSAFQASAVMVPPFKKPPKAELDVNKSYFNKQLVKPRVKTEHTIGLLKARFQYFKSIRAELADKTSMRKIIRYFMCSVIFHNMLIAEPVPEEWEEEINELMKENRISDNDELNLPVDQHAKGDERRRQLFAYLLDLRG